MTDKRDDGGPAFPIGMFQPGMTLRDWFAGQALVGFMEASSCDFDDEPDAAFLYRVADAMIAARKERSDET